MRPPYSVLARRMGPGGAGAPRGARDVTNPNPCLGPARPRPAPGPLGPSLERKLRSADVESSAVWTGRSSRSPIGHIGTAYPWA